MNALVLLGMLGASALLGGLTGAQVATEAHIRRLRRLASSRPDDAKTLERLIRRDTRR